MLCDNYILSNRSRWTFYFSKVFNLILQSAKNIQLVNISKKTRGQLFEVNIKKIDDTKEPPKYPYIISGKGLGSIDDIGGVWSWEDYYNTPEDEMDPELLDWIGGEKIDLDKFDKEELNEGLQHPPYWE